MRLMAILLGVFVASKAWILKSNYKDVEIQRTSNVYLVCQYDAAPGKTSQIDRLWRIRIYRVDAEGGKRTFEKVGVDDKSQKTEGREVTSNFENVQRSFLNVTWPIATEETPGEYGCEVVGYTKESDPVAQATSHLTIKKRSLTLQDLLKMIEETKSDFQVKEHALQTKIESLENQLADAIDAYGKIGQEIMGSLNQTAMQLKNESLGADLLIRQEVNDIKTKYQEADAHIRRALRDSVILNADDLERQEGKIRELKEDIQDDLSDLKNFTYVKLEKHGENVKTIQSNLLLLTQLVENTYVTKTTFDEQLSIMFNFTAAEISSNKDSFLKLENFTIKELGAVDDKLRKRILELNTVIRNVSNECETKRIDLWLNVTELNTKLVNRIKGNEDYNRHRKNDVDNNFQNISNFVESVNIKYENITNSLREDLATKSQCVCPTAQPTNPSTEGNTTEVKLESTTSKIIQLPTETTINIASGAPSTFSSTSATEPVVFNVNEWPEGTYALVAPKSGCPDYDGITWEEGWKQFHTSIGLNKDFVSKGNHFKKPILRHSGIDNFVQIHYCLRNQSISNSRLWPRGSYCINRVNKRCPSGFKSGYIQYDEEYVRDQQRHRNSPDFYHPSKQLKHVYYCCRKDGPTDEAMVLPAKKPFYLYRVNDASCQEVSGMKVSVEIVQIDTNRSNNKDAFEDTDLHPHASLNPVRHEMCYYSPITDA